MKTLLLIAALLPGLAQAGLMYKQRVTFEDAMDSYLIDDYQNAGYLHGDLRDDVIYDLFSNEAMSNVFGETTYRSTQWSDRNYTAQYMAQDDNRFYCAGCNGSFELGFEETSLFTTGVGIDIVSNYNWLQYNAYVTYGDGSSENFLLPLEENAAISTIFWGVSSLTGISSIHFGGADGYSVFGGSFAIDNLTTGTQAVSRAAVPEPGTWLLFGLGLLLFQVRRLW